MRPLLASLAVSLLLLSSPAVTRADSPQVAVPSVVGFDVPRAEHTLARAGLAARVIGTQEGFGRAIVTGQSPAAGAVVRAGAQVRLTYRIVEPGDAPPSPPSAPRTVTMPNVVGLDPVRAERVLQDAGLGARLIGPTAGTGGFALVVGQNPAAGSSVTRGSTARVTWRWQR
jgi:beta-lactam-binding protein with PASTA domain